MKIKEIIETLEEFAPKSLAESYDNVGLLVGDTQREVSGVLLTLDITEGHIDEAISKGINLIISHHPVIFSGMKSLTGGNMTERIVIKAIRSNIALYACHTNIDNAYNGVSYRMGELMGITMMEPMVSSGDGSAKTGLGVVGELPVAMEPCAFFAILKERFGVKMLRHSEICIGEIKKVALCGGSGASFIGDAKRCGVDVYITGDMKYHDFFAAEGEIILCDIGHFESEQYTIDIFYDVLMKKNINFAVCKSILNCNPINYL